jgi:hypothetical protein
VRTQLTWAKCYEKARKAQLTQANSLDPLAPILFFLGALIIEREGDFCHEKAA